ncbi:MAG TPA: condensation domain-containing protein, partial [Thermoanaerobaculia bacterium]|nr:condensation domain-containing protein [Thermoanaerobaculia bacterium]
FDVSVWELFWPLMVGARLVVAPPGVHREAAKLAAEVRRHGVTTMHFVPSMLTAFLAEPTAGECDSLVRVVASGEALPPALVGRFFEALPGSELHNLYGPTEASVDVTWWPCTDADADGVVPIGRPIANTRLHVVDRDGRELPVGVAGELLLGGVQLARGYLARPGLTADRFVPDPYGDEAGGRLYRTGDLARWLPDGSVEFLGRIDHQVKVRGHRIELGEVEAALGAVDGVAECAVMARGEVGETRLVAWLVREGDDGPGVETLRRALLAALPEPMVPSQWVFVDAMPLSPNGKLDRRALPEPDAARPDLEREYVAPSGPLEEILAAAFSRGLGVDRVGVDDDFFALGGDSILSLRVVGAARSMGLELTLPQVFEHRTVRRLAVAADLGTEPPPAPLVAFELLTAADRAALPDDVEDAYPLTRLQAGMLFHSSLAAAGGVYHDLYSVHLDARWDEAALRRALDTVTVRHPLLRTSFALAGYGEALQLVHRGARVPLAVTDLSPLAGDEAEAAIGRWSEAETRRPFEPAEAPLVRCRVHVRSAGDFQLSLSFHHAVLDGWSVASLATELFAAYLAALDGAEPPAPPPPAAGFRDYVARERRALASDATRRFWAERTAGLGFTPLPRWPVGAGVGEGDGVRRVGAHRVELPAGLAADLGAA